MGVAVPELPALLDWRVTDWPHFSVARWKACQHWSSRETVSGPLSTGVDCPVGAVNHSGVDSPESGASSPPSWEVGMSETAGFVGVGLMMSDSLLFDLAPVTAGGLNADDSLTRNLEGKHCLTALGNWNGMSLVHASEMERSLPGGIEMA